MLYRNDFSVWFVVDGIHFREEYTLPYRTEEQQICCQENTTLYQSAKAAIAKDLGIRRECLSIAGKYKLPNTEMIRMVVTELAINIEKMVKVVNEK